MLQKPKVLLILIFLLALFLRLYQLSTFPVGFHADEVRVAWNALSILKTGMDDQGNHLALYYNTFGDYRPIGIFYFTIPFLIIFGQNEFAVRFASAFFGALTVFPLFLFILEIIKIKKPKAVKDGTTLALLSALLLTISPWHLEVSRATSEVSISLFFALFGLYFLVKLINRGGLKSALMASISIGISFFLYHSIRVLAPLFFVVVILFFFSEIKKLKSKKMLVGCLLFVFLITFLFSITVEAKRRFEQVSIANDLDTTYEVQRLKQEDANFNPLFKFLDNKYIVYTRKFIMEYPDYFSSDFLIGYEARPYRYSIPGTGLVTYPELLLFVLGLWAIFKGKASYLPLWLLLLAPLPAAITTEDAPNLHRAFYMVPFFLIIESYGFLTLLQIKKYHKQIKILTFILLFSGFFFFEYMYFYHGSYHKPFIQNYSLDGSSFRNVGSKELALKLEEIQGKYDKIIVTNSPDDLYPWYAFFNHKDPQEFNKYAIARKDGQWQYQNIVFSQKDCPSSYTFKSDKTTPRLLVVDAGPANCAYDAEIKDGIPEKIVDQIYRSNGSVVYTLLERK